MQEKESMENTSKIIFKNQPELSVHEADKAFNERRLNLIPQIEDLISNHELFKNKEVNITFLGNGVSSLVCLLETPDEKVILKVPLRQMYSEGDGQFMKVWEQAGVKVPHIIEEGVLGEHTYTLCEYIEAKTLGELYTPEELVQRKTFVEMGKTLRAMHVPEAEGYGYVVNQKAEYSTFKEWLESPELKKKIDYVIENKILGEEHGSLDDALHTLTEFVNTENRSSYCHEDFTTYNIFDTQPLTVFDPNPRFNHGYIDLARCITGTVMQGDPEETRSQIIEGYFGKEPYNTKALQAAILLFIYMKLPYSHKTNKLQRIENIKEYLLRTKYLLGK